MRQDLSIQQRQSHLLSMGVAQWYSRTVLLGAKSSPDKLFEEAVVAPQVEFGESQSAPKDLLNSLKGREISVNKVEVDSALSPSLIQSSIDTASSSPAVNEGIVQSKELDEHVSSTDKLSEEISLSVRDELSPVSAFSVNCYLSAEYIVISECSGQSGVRRESQLLVNIFKSLDNLKLASSNLEYFQSFNWPVFHSLNLQSGQSAELNEAIKLWFKGISNQQKKIFYFGESQLALQGLVAECLSGMNMFTFKYSLQDMLQIPTRKKDVWVQLQAYTF